MRNSVAHTPGPFPAAEVAPNGGASAVSGGSTYGYGDNKERLRNSSIQRVPERLGAIKDVPEHRRGSEVEGGALAAWDLAGAEKEEEAETAWAMTARPGHQNEFQMAQRYSPSN